ncbi:MAG: cell division protein FtsZ [Candidatus Roizmanbacteria bacterium]|nr:cell division protein FtsZ [Candidatus Roizmanbacteria bacterium]
MLIKPRAGQAARIKVVGVGGGGGNALSFMVAEGGINGVEFIAVNTDAQALLNNKATIKIQIGENLTKGLGSGGDPEVGRQAAEESRERLKEDLSGADMIFLACGEGGGTGTGASPLIAEIAKETGALTIAVVTKPFEFEGSKRKFCADEGIMRLKEKVDTLIVVPNQRVLNIIDKKTPILEAFKKIDAVLHQGVKGIAELITTPGLINVDFADIRTIMKGSGTALMGVGIGSGDKRAIAAIKQAISSPLLDISIEGARGVLFNVVGGQDLTMAEVDEAASIIAKSVDPDADIIFGAVIDDKMMDQIKVTIIATKFDDNRLKLFRFKKSEEVEQDKPAFAKAMAGKERKLDEEIDKEEMNNNDEFIDDDSSEFDIPAFLRKK